MLRPRYRIHSEAIKSIAKHFLIYMRGKCNQIFHAQQFR